MATTPRPRAGGRSSRRRREVFVAVSEHEGPGGLHERLELTPDAIIVVREQDGRAVAESIPLRDLRRVRTKARVGRVELLVALSYLLGASVFLYLVVNLIDRLQGALLLGTLGVLVFFAAGGVAAAWFGQEAFLQFVSRGEGRRVEYRLDETERERLAALREITRLQDRD